MDLKLNQMIRRGGGKLPAYDLDPQIRQKTDRLMQTTSNQLVKMNIEMQKLILPNTNNVILPIREVREIELKPNQYFFC